MDLIQKTISADYGDKNSGRFRWHIKDVPQNYHAAIDWYFKAVHPVAQYRIGALYCYGSDMPQDYIQAMEWYLKAADQGYVVAQHNIRVL